jgi:alkylation response protein AidB-like acyl-CoA dehydrogenase
MAQPKATSTKSADYTPPPINGDFYRIASVLDDKDRALLSRVRQFTEGVVAPVIEDFWARDEFPFALIPKMAEIGIGGIGYQGYGAAGGSWLLNGLVAMELRRRFVDCDVLGLAYGPVGRLDLFLRRRGAEAALAAPDDALREDRLIRFDGAVGWGRRHRAE